MNYTKSKSNRFYKPASNRGGGKASGYSNSGQRQQQRFGESGSGSGKSRVSKKGLLTPSIHVEAVMDSLDKSFSGDNSVEPANSSGLARQVFRTLCNCSLGC